ncbi:alpha/beta fold hydrolase [Kribbella catacumbae]|uniref:alpha/beta fold hydrolase n=1 Tax=Kribbella catacumbae TaxID=460086 RepID=UPI0003A681F5|nr:alpha/beta hydrolase [Kribbella catacumbae]
MSTVRSADGTELAYSQVGSGPAVILIDGATGFRAFNQTSSQIADLLSGSFTVYTYDRRGRGESSWNDASTTPAEDEIADLAAMIGAAGGSAALWGISSGGILALEAVRVGLPVTKLAVYEPPFIVSDIRPPLPTDYVEQLQTAVADGRRDDAAKIFLTKAVGMPEEYLGGVVGSPFWPTMLEVAHTIANDGAIVGKTMSGDPAALDRYAEIVTETLVAYGDQTDASIIEGDQLLAKVVPNATLEVLPGQTHDVAADAIAPVLLRFFS